MTDKKPIVIDLCKIGWAAWFIISSVFVSCLICEESANMSWTEKVKHEKGDWLPTDNGNSIRYDPNATRTYVDDCYKGILDGGPQCQSDNTEMHDLFVNSSYIFMAVNGLNGYLLFVALNRKYGKYEFKFKTCGGELH